MKLIAILFFSLFALGAQAQNLNSLSKAAASATSMLDDDTIGKIAGDQVMKLAKKLNLSEPQQKKVTDLVVNQLKTEKFQKMLSNYSGDELMGSEASDDISKELMTDASFNKDLDKVLTDDQKKASRSMMKEKK